MSTENLLGDKTKIKVDTMVNTTNNSLLGGDEDGVTIHPSVDPELFNEHKGLADHDAKLKDGVTRQIVEAAIYGGAIGDAIGVPYEFMLRHRIKENPCTDMVGYGVFNKPAGTFSDDTSMVIATLDGIVKMKNIEDYSAIMQCYLDWLNNENYTVDGVFDVGITCLKSIRNYANGIPSLDCGQADINSNGNGSLMRIMPAILYSLKKWQSVDNKFVESVGSLTHAHEISGVACKLYGEIVNWLAVRDKLSDKANECVEIKKQEVFHLCQHLLLEYDTTASKAFCRLGRREFYDLPESEIKSTGYVVDTLEAAMWCFTNTTSYRDCILKAVNLGSDTDTIASIAGGLAGIYYGKDGIPKEWMEKLRGKKIIDELIDKFCKKLGCF